MSKNVCRSRAATTQDLTIDVIGRQESTASSCGGITPFAKRPTPLVDGRWYSEDCDLVDARRPEDQRTAAIPLRSAFVDAHCGVEDDSDSSVDAKQLHEERSSRRTESHCGSASSTLDEAQWNAMFAAPSQHSNPVSAAYLPTAPVATLQAAPGTYSYNPYSADVLPPWSDAMGPHESSDETVVRDQVPYEYPEAGMYWEYHNDESHGMWAQQPIAYEFPQHGVHNPDTCQCESCGAAKAVRARERAAPYVARHRQVSPQRQAPVLPTDVTVLAALSGGATTQHELRTQSLPFPDSTSTEQPALILRFVPPQLPPLVLVTVMGETLNAEESHARYLTMAARWYTKIVAVQHLFLEAKVDESGNVVETPQDQRCPEPNVTVLQAFSEALAPTGHHSLSDEDRAVFRAWVQAARAWWLHHFEHAQTSRPKPGPQSVNPALVPAFAAVQSPQANPAQQRHYGHARGGAFQAALHPHSAVLQAPSTAPFATHAAPNQGRFVRRR